MEEDSPQQNQTPLRRPVRAIPQEEEEKKERIKTWMAACLAIVALCVDVVQALLTLVAIGVVASPVISVGANLLFWIWFKTLNVSFVGNPKKLASYAIAAILEEIPAVDVLPWFTIGIIIIILLTRAEDKGGLLGKAASLAEGKIKV